MTSLTKEQILQAQDKTVEAVSVPEWSGQVFIRTMTGTERDKFESWIINSKTGETRMDNIRAKLIALTVCDESGNRIFADNEVSVVGGKSAAALDRLFEVSQRVNRIGTSDIEELKKTSDIESNGDSGLS